MKSVPRRRQQRTTERTFRNVRSQPQTRKRKRASANRQTRLLGDTGQQSGLHPRRRPATASSRRSTERKSDSRRQDESERRIQRRHSRGHRAASAPSLDRLERQSPTSHHRHTPTQRAAWRVSFPETDSLSDGAPLWLACRFTDLPVDAVVNDPDRGAVSALNINPLAPLVVHDGHARQPVIVACNESARTHGLHAGMRLGVAHTLVAGIQAVTRDSTLESKVLELLAVRAMTFSSKVVLEPPQTLLIEIGSSLRLFQSLETLLHEFTQSFTGNLMPSDAVRGDTTQPDTPQADATHDGHLAPDVDTARSVADSSVLLPLQSSYRLSMAVAPTASAAQLLSHSPGEHCIVASDQLRSALAAVPLNDLPVSQRNLKTLRGMGLARLGDLMRLPRDGLARRVGPELVTLLDQLIGSAPDPRRHFIPEDYFRSAVTLTDDITTIDQLLIIARRLMDELEHALLARASGVHQLDWRFDHHDRSTTRLTLNLSSLSQRAAHFASLMHTRTENMQLIGPVHTVTLQTSRFEPVTMQAGGLFPDLEQDSAHFDLIDRLRARLGDECITSVTELGEHAPERAWAPGTPGAKRSLHTPHKAVSARRPVWLMATPRPLRIRNGQPWLNGPLLFIEGPERIETGWWEENVRRDYYTALSRRGRHLWIFHDITSNTWCVQGVFV